jgi:hypothetical protein
MTMIARLLMTLLLVLTLAPEGSAQNLQFDRDVSPELKAQVLADLQWIAGVEGSRTSPLHQEIFGPVHGGAYAQWFNSRVFFFGVDGCGGGNAVACVKSKYDNKVFVTLQYTQGKAPQVGRLMTLYHEARHTEKENNMWSHSRCPASFPYRSIWTGARLRGKTACDSTAYGSYASASVLLNNLARFCTNCTDKVRADAKLYSDDQVKRVVGAAPMARLKADFAE